MAMFDFNDMCNGTVGGAIAGGILGSMFGDTAAEKAVVHLQVRSSVIIYPMN